MNWFKENPFLSGLIAVAVAGLGALGYLVSQAASAYTLANDSYVAAVTKLHGLQNRSPFPSQENLDALKASFEDYKARLSALRDKLTGMEMSLNMEISPQQFQDELRTAVNTLREKASAAGVKLPENFYLGFDQYQTTVPTAQATPYLDRQFRVLRAIVERLIDFRVHSVDGIVRTPLPQELPAVAPAATPAPAQGNRPANAKPAATVLERFPFQITFTAEQGKLRVAFNSLLDKEQFLIVRSVNLVNSNPNPPARGGDNPVPVQDPFATAAAPQAAAAGSNLQVIFGRELVKAVMDLEMIDFADAPTN